MNFTEQDYAEVGQMARDLIKAAEGAKPVVALTALCEALATVGARRPDLDDAAIEGFILLVEESLRESFADILRGAGESSIDCRKSRRDSSTVRDKWATCNFCSG